MGKLRRFGVGFLAGIPIGLLSLLGVPVSLLLFYMGVKEIISFRIMNFLFHVGLNTLTWLLIGAIYAHKRKKWMEFAGFATSLIAVAFTIALLIVIAVVIAILTLPPGL